MKDLRLVKVTTSLGDLFLRRSEITVLSRLMEGEASPEEALEFYAQVSQRSSQFPLEWESHVLRSNLKAYPDRLDLLRRLAVVELSTHERGPLDDAIEFELRLLQLQNVSLLGQRGSGEHRLSRRRAIELAVSVLSSPVLLERSCHDAAQTIRQIHDTFMSSPGEDLTVVAEAGLQAFTLLLQDVSLTLPPLPVKMTPFYLNHLGA